MFSSTFQLNADLEKSIVRKAFLRATRLRVLRRALRRCKSKAAIDIELARISHLALRTAEAPILDAPRLRAGAWAMAHGLIALTLGAAGAAWSVIDPPEGLAAVVLTILTLFAVVGGLFLVAMGRGLRRLPHLPRAVIPADVDQAKRLLEETAESSRPPAGAYCKHIVAALMILDAAVLLYLGAPVLLPDTVPMVQLLVIGVAAFLVARISLEAIDAIARGVRRAQVQHLYSLKIAEGTEDSKATAKAIHDEYDGVMGSYWPVDPGMSVYLAPILWAIPLIGLQVLLLSVRLIAGDDNDMIAVMVVAGTISALTTLFAVRTAIYAECLTPAIANAKRLLGRFPTADELCSTLKSDCDFLNERLAQANCWIAAVIQPKLHGAQAVEVEPLKIPEHAVAVSAPAAAPALALAPAAAR